MVLPVKFSFIEGEYFWWIFFDYVMDASFFIDIILTFFTPIEGESDEEMLISSHAKIAYSYLKFWFWIDIASVLPLGQFINQGDLAIFLRFSKLPKLYKIAKISKLMRTVRASRKQDSIYSKIYNIIKLNPGIDRLFMNLFSIFIFCHLLACFWHFIAQSSSGQDNWIWQLNLMDATPQERYLTSLYWIVQTVITVGYGDVTITNATERIIAIVAMFAGVIFFSLIIGSLTALIGDMDKRGAIYENKLDVLLELKNTYNVSNTTFEKVHWALKYKIYRSEETYVEFLDGLPENLKVQVGFKIYKPLVEGINFFSTLEDEMIARLGPLLKTIPFNANEMIFQEGEYSKEMFFIKQGTVEYVLPSYDYLPFMTVRKGNYFGEIDMLFGQNRKFASRAQTEVELLVLNLDNYNKNFQYESKYKSISSNLRKNAIKKRIRQIKLFERAVEACETFLTEQSLNEGIKERTLMGSSPSISNEVFPVLLSLGLENIQGVNNEEGGLPELKDCDSQSRGNSSLRSQSGVFRRRESRLSSVLGTQKSQSFRRSSTRRKKTIIKVAETPQHNKLLKKNTFLRRNRKRLGTTIFNLSSDQNLMDPQEGSDSFGNDSLARKWKQHDIKFTSVETKLEGIFDLIGSHKKQIVKQRTVELEREIKIKERTLLFFQS